MGETLIILAVGVAMVYFAVRMEVLRDRNYQQEVRLKATLELIEAREAIEYYVFGLHLESEEVVTQVAVRGEPTQAEFDEITRKILAKNDEIEMILGAPGRRIKVISPLAGHEALVNKSYKLIPEPLHRLSDIELNGKARLDGPINRLFGSGQAMLFRQLVFREDQGAGSRSSFWGTVTFVLDLERFLEKSGLNRLSENYDFYFKPHGIQPVITEGRPMQLAIGDASILDRDPVVLDFEFQGSKWEISTIPKTGWPIHAPGMVWFILSSGFLILAAMGGLAYVFGLVEARQTARLRFKDSVNSMTDGFAMFDPQGRLIDYNPAYVDLFRGIEDTIRKPGVTAAELFRARLDKKLDAIPEGGEEAWLRERMAALELDQYTAEQQLTDGKVILTNEHRTSEGGRVTIKVDVTGIKKALREAEAANLAKGQFIATLSHELRTPLTVVLGLANLGARADLLPQARELREAVAEDPPNPERLHKAVEAMFDLYSDMMGRQSSSGEHLLRLIEEMLSFSSIEAGTIKVKSERFDVSEVVERVVGSLRTEAEAKGLKLEATGGCHQALGDQTRTRQILYNLVGNAIKYTDRGRIDVSVEEAGDLVAIRVADTGIGIPESGLGVIFEPFRQLDSSDTRSRAGTGLGLAIAHELAQKQGGNLTVTSREGEGSTFTLTLKSAPVEAPQPEVAAPA